jgi:hypothetical protein
MKYGAKGGAWIFVLVVIGWALALRWPQADPRSKAEVSAEARLDHQRADEEPPGSGRSLRPMTNGSPAIAQASKQFAVATSPPLLPNAAIPANAMGEASFARFMNWSSRWIQGPEPGAAGNLHREGMLLVEARRAQLEDLIQSNPKRALELAVPEAVRGRLPEAVAARLESWIDTIGDLNVLAAYPEPGHESEVKPIVREVVLADRTLQAFVYGRREGAPTRRGVRLHGIVLDNLMAVSENATRQLPPEDPSALLVSGQYRACAVCGRMADFESDELAVHTGDEVVVVCSETDADLLNSALDLAETDEAMAHAASTWTEGTKNMILIRVDFPDLSGAPFADATGINLISNVNQFYLDSSYGKTGFQLYGSGSEMTPTFRMPQAASYYGTNNYADQLRKDARAAAKAAGYNLSLYRFDLICFTNAPGWTWAGLGYVGAAGVWLRNSFGAGVAAHELGHNFGLSHANFWDTGGESVIGAGNSIEYGDKFDTMGSAGAGAKHFNARYKSYLNWLVSTNVLAVTNSGLYQLYPHDVTNIGVCALSLRKDSRTNYWVEFRQKYTSNRWLMNGVSLRWAQSGGQSTLLLDTTPGSVDGKDDAAIVWGQTFGDPSAGIYLTPWDLVDTTPPSIRLMVNLGKFNANTAPQLQVSAVTSEAAVNAPISFSAIAADPEGDTLAYAWDFGDHNFGENQAAQSHQWSAAGQYQVRCVASDMKGGSASAALVVSIGHPTTFVASGQVWLGTQPLANVRISAGSTQSSLTTTDGSFVLPGLANGAYTLQARLSGFTFVHPGFTNPVTIHQHLGRLDFYALPQSGQTVLTLVPDGSVWKYLDNGTDQGTAWREPGYNDGAWREGPAPLGYGDNDVATVVGYGPDSRNKYTTTYLRQAFVVTNLASVASATLALMRDDGAAVYLNGREVFRSNLPAGTLTYRTLASATVSGSDETKFFETDLNPALLLEGTNWIAVEVHQANLTSSDIGFDLRLTATKASAFPAPELSWERSVDALLVSWPAAFSGWSLNTAFQFEPSMTWRSIDGGLFLTNGHYTARIPITNEQQYFILKPAAARP